MSNTRNVPLSVSKEKFRSVGHQLVDTLADFLDQIPDGPVTRGESPKEILGILGGKDLPESGMDMQEVLHEATELMLQHSLLNGHPRFFGYITSSPAPIGALADMLAAVVNQNVGANILSPMATAIEKQTISWLASFLGLSDSWGGILVSGGNMANLTAFLTARTIKGGQFLKTKGLAGAEKEMVFYCSQATHTWIEKAAVLFGHGTDAIRWIRTDASNCMDLESLSATIEKDMSAGKQPFMVVGNAGDVSTGVVDDLAGIAAVCKQYDLWFHIDGAYGIPAAVLPEQADLFAAITDADSIAMDPHKWLYAPLEAGCTLVKDPAHLETTFSSHPAYYNFTQQGDEHPTNFYEYGLQNSRGFRALKVWMALKQVGRAGYQQMIGDDIELARMLFDMSEKHPELEAVSCHLSITTLRYVPAGEEHDQDYLNELNEKILNRLQLEGKAFLSNAVIRDNYCLRACIVNFRTTKEEISKTIDIIIDTGRTAHAEMRS